MPAIGAIYQITYQSTLAGQLVENVWHFREITGASTQAQIAASAQGMLPLQAQLQATVVVYTSIIIKEMTPVAFDETLVIPTQTHGNVGAVPITSTVAPVFTKRTGTAGKTHRGRMYLAGLPDTYSDDHNRYNTAGAAQAGTFTAAVMSLYGPTGSDPHLQIGIYSRTLGGSHPFTVAGWQPMTSFETQLIFGNQRRRRIGVGV
jgi:hypothetical protein